MNKTIAKATYWVRLAAIGTAATSLSLVSTVPPLFAGDLAPNCVSFRTYTKKATEYAAVTNKCTYGLRVNVVLAFGVDGPCKYYEKNQTWTTSWPRVPRQFDRLEKC